jgi:hypothetical protein
MYGNGVGRWEKTRLVRVNLGGGEARASSALLLMRFEYSVQRQNIQTIAAGPVSEFSHVPSQDSENSPGSGPGVSRRPLPWLLVPGPVAGVERLRANGECL